MSLRDIVKDVKQRLSGSHTNPQERGNMDNGEVLGAQESNGGEVHTEI